MATVLTESDTFSPTVTGPDDGDTRNAASVNSAFQSLTNRTRRLLNAAVGHLLWNGRLSVRAATTGIGVYVGAIESVVIGERLLSQAAETELAGKLPLAGLSSWYYVYAYDNAGTLALQASLDPPDATQTWKSTGDLTHRYLGCFKTDGAGAPIYLEGTRGAYQWMNAPATREPLAAGAAIGATNVVCSSYAPPHARLLRLRLRTADTTGADRTSSILPTGTGVTIDTGEAPANAFGVRYAEIPCDSAQSFDYLVSSADARLKINVHGWRE